MREPDLLGNLLVYLTFVGGGHILITILLVAITALFTLHQPIRFWKTAERILILNVLMLLTGAAFNLLWNSQIVGHLYYNWDVFFDFIPYWPVQLGILNPLPDQPQTGLAEGVAFWQIRVLWLGFALAAWATIIVGYRKIDTSLMKQRWGV